MLDIRIQLVADYWLWLPARRQDQLVGGAVSDRWGVG